eukprot:SRR837773.3859.p1 GENE.SRR837773.3859~~SRR837773.3859.p1  ORF type:complete len:248 (-),score=63.13 SRR837773.3859:25-735(-)
MIQCEVCFTSGPRFPLARLTTGNGDELRKEDCMHNICQECLAGHIKARVEQQQVCIRCPALACGTRLFESDLKRLAEAGALERGVVDRFAEIARRDYSARAAAILMEDLDLVEKLVFSARLCPRCQVVIERSYGCSSMYCICGHHFDFQTAPRVAGLKVKPKYFLCILNRARMTGTTLKDAEQEIGKFGSMRIFRKGLKTAEQLGLPLEEAVRLHERAQAGDEAAQAEIRKGRGKT